MKGKIRKPLWLLPLFAVAALAVAACSSAPADAPVPAAPVPAAPSGAGKTLTVARGVATETVFAWPGLGFMTVQAIINNDFPVMTTAVMVFTILYLFVVFIVDVLYAYIDPRIRLG